MARRQSNLEALRITAMLMIVVLHFFNDDRLPDLGTAKYWVYIVYESLAICGVNLFVFLTGYFSLNQNSIRVRKIINILLTIAFWELVGYILSMVFFDKTFQIKELLRSMFPIIFGGRWFIKAYIILICLIPFLNKLIHKISMTSYRLLLIIQVFLFCLWPSFLPNPPFDDYGYSFVHFITLYIIIGYIRLYINRYPRKCFCLLGYFLCSGIVLLCKLTGFGYEWAYNSPFVILEALFLFLFFVQLHIQNLWINKIAACAFGVYLIHTNMFFNNIGFEQLFHGSQIVNGNTNELLVCVPACALFFYLLGFGLESIRKYAFKYSVDLLLNKIKVINKKLLVEDAEPK